MEIPALAIAIGGIAIIVVLLILGILSRYRVAKPNEALIVSGRKGSTGSPQRVVTGGAFVWPIVQTYSVLDLSARRISVSVRGAVSKQGIRLNVDGVAVVRVNAEDEGSIRAVASRYLTQQAAISVDTTEVLAGALRSIIGTMSVDQILRDRVAFAAQVAEVTESSLTGTGLALDSFQIQEIIDEGYGQQPGTYLRDLERPEAARAAQEAAIAEAESRKVAEQKRIEAEQAVLEAQRALDLRTADISAETDAAKAKAAAAGPLAAAEREQVVLAEQQKVAIQQSALTDKELDTTVRKPADAAKYKTEVDAEAARIASVLQAEARAAATVAAAEAKAKEDELTGLGEQKRRAALAEAEAVEGAKRGEAQRAEREAVAQAVRAEGLAQAESTQAVGLAEAEAMEKKAAAYARYNQAAVLEMLIASLPQIAKELAAPMSAIDNLTVVSTEGASAVSRTVTDNFTQLQTMLKDTVGVDLAGMMKQFTNTDSDTPSNSLSPAPHPETRVSLTEEGDTR